MVGRQSLIRCSADIFLTDLGWSAHVVSSPTFESKIRYGRREVIGHFRGYFDLTAPLDDDEQLLVDLPGFAVDTYRDHLDVSIHHWLVVSTFILFYAVLKFIYRKRPEVQPCED